MSSRAHPQIRLRVLHERSQLRILHHLRRRNRGPVRGVARVVGGVFLTHHDVPHDAANAISADHDVSLDDLPGLQYDKRGAWFYSQDFTFQPQCDIWSRELLQEPV